VAVLTVVTWLWGDKYGVEDVIKLRNGVRRHLKQEHRFVLITDRDTSIIGLPTFHIPAEDRYLLAEKGCFARLRIFDPAFQRTIGADERIVCLDLDTVVVGELDQLFDKPVLFAILQGANASNPCPFNCSMMMLTVGFRPDVWQSFDMDAARKVPHFTFPDDQAWLAVLIPDAAGWQAGEDGVYAFKKPGWPKNTNNLPKDARIVFFPGWRSPALFMDLDWVRLHWR
jgi:hypothetical protein